jgi:hypothetical protein
MTFEVETSHDEAGYIDNEWFDTFEQAKQFHDLQLEQFQDKPNLLIKIIERKVLLRSIRN